MLVEFCKWGNSLAVRIPKTVAEALKVGVGRQAELAIENGALVLRPIKRPKRKPTYTLEELLRGMTRSRLGNYAATRTGNLAAYCPDVGDIIWLDFLQAIANEQAGRRPALGFPRARSMNRPAGASRARSRGAIAIGISMLRSPGSTTSRASFKPTSCAACPGRSADHALSAWRLPTCLMKSGPN